MSLWNACPFFFTFSTVVPLFPSLAVREDGLYCVLDALKQFPADLKLHTSCLALVDCLGVQRKRELSASSYSLSSFAVIFGWF